MKEIRLAKLVVKLWRLHQRFNVLGPEQWEGRNETFTEIMKVLRQLQPKEATHD